MEDSNSTLNMKSTIKFLTISVIVFVFTSNAFSQVPSYVPTSGLVGYWPFNGNANDESGNGNNGTVNGATLTTDRFGNVNSAYVFSGGANISVPHNANQNISSVGTWSAWVDVSSFTAAGTTSQLISKYNSNLNQRSYVLELELSKFKHNVHDGITWHSVTSATSMQINEWRQVTVVFDKTASPSLKLYLDGTLSATDDSYHGDLPIHSLPIIFGNSSGIALAAFNGEMDDIGIWNRALTPQEITNLYTSTVPVSCLPAYVPTSGLVGYWPFCGNANDESGNGNNGTVNGAMLTNDRNGISNSCYDYNGISNQITIPNSLSLNPSEISINVWIYALSDNLAILEKGNVSNASNHGYAITHNDGWQIQRGLKSSFGDGTCSITNNIVWSDYNIFINNEWVMITVSIDNLGIIKHYKNGNLIYTSSNNSPLNSCNNPASTLRFGGPHWNNDPEWFLGKIDDIGIWNRALTQQEITNLYTSTVPPTAAILSGDATICAGAATNLSVAVTGGTAPYTVTVTDGTNIYSATGASPVSIPVSPTSTSTYTIVSVTGGGTGTGNTGTATVTVIDATITASDSTICAGDTVQLSVIGGCSGQVNGAPQWQLIIPGSAYSGNEINFNSSGFNQSSQTWYSVLKDASTNRVYAFNLASNVVASLTSINAPGELYSYSFDQTNSRLVASLAGRDAVYSLPLLGGSWQQIGSGGFDSESYGSNAFWNNTSNRFSFFGGYGGYSTKNWIWENNGSSWINPYPNNNNCNPARRVGNRIASNALGTKLYIFSGLGSCDGNQLATSCSLGSPWPTDVGVYCWLRDLWELDLSTYQFTNIIPVNNQSITREGAFAFDYSNNAFYNIGGRAPTASYGVYTPFTMDISRFRNGIDTVFLNIVVGGPAPTADRDGVSVYDSIGNRIIYARNDGIWAINLGSACNLTYLWSTGETTATINPTPTSTTTYTCTTTINGVSCTDSVTVIVNNPTIDLGNDVTVCGTSTTLTATTGNDSYVWSNGATTNTTTVTANGTYTCTVTQGGCSASDSIDVIFVDARISASDSTICAGENIMLNVPSYSVGDSIISPAIYLANITQGSVFEYSSTVPPAGWQTSSGGWPQGALPFSGVDTGSVPNTTYWPLGSTYYLRKQIDLTNYNLSSINWSIGVDNGYSLYLNGVLISSDNQGGPATEWEYIGDFPQNLLNLGTNYIALIISDDGAGGASFNMKVTGNKSATHAWSPSGATTPTINVSPTTTTTYTCTTSTNGVSCTDSVTVVVNNPTIDLGNDVAACGTSTTLTAPTGYDSYLWSNGATTNTTTVTANGTYSCVVTQGGCSASDTIDVTLIDATISASDSVICVGDSVTLSVPQGGSSNTACAALPTNLQSGLVGYWPFCGNANDASGNGNSGTVNGATLTTDRFGSANNAYSFSTIDQNFIAASQNGMSNDSGTYVTWINFDGPIAEGNPNLSLDWYTVIDPLMLNSNSNSSNYRKLLFNLNNQPTSSENLTFYDWHQIAVTVEPNANVTFFIDGINCGSQSITNSYSLVSFSNLFLIGKSSNNAWYWNGKIDDITIYNRALSPSEIQQLYTLGQSTYLWSNGATTASISVTPTQTTTYTCTVTTNGASCTDSVTVVVNNPTIDLGNDVTVCGTSTTLTAPTGFDSYLWSNGATTNTTTVTANGTYACTVTQGLCSARDSIDVTFIDATITASDSTICVGETTTLSVPQGGSSNTSCAALPTNLQSGLVGYWPFCGNANDASGNGNNGTVNGPSLTTDRFGNANSAYFFNKVEQDIITIPNSSIYNFSSSFSVNLWYKLDSNQPQSTSGPDYNVFISKHQGGTLNSSFIVYTENVCMPITYMTTVNDVIGYITYPTMCNTSDWHMISMTFGSSNLKMYFDGILYNTYSGLQNVKQTILPLLIGESMRGNIDDIVMWGRNLSSAEIQQIYNLGQTTYSWSTGASTPTINISPTSTTTYTCTTTINGVSCTDSITVVVNNPILDLGSDVTACGTSTTLTAPAGFDSYLWSNGGTTNSTTVNANGTYTCTVTQGGCIASDSIDVVLVPLTTNTTPISACNSYVWNGTTYNASGVYTGTTSNCVTESLNLTITPSSTNTTTISSCGPYTWVNNGQTYTQSGVYTGTSANCVTQSLNLTIIPATTTGSVTTSICTGGSYIWPVNGQTYTTAQSGITIVTGCNTATLNLTITPNSINTTTASACTSLTWNGTTYTASGVYTGATANCVTQSLNLTINPSSTNTTTISSCGTYTWGNNGQTYTSSGVYSGTTANCVTQSLNLTIIPNTSVTTTINANDTYTWVANGLTYTTSGIYTGPTSANCVTQYLNLTINSSGLSEEELELFSLYPNPVSDMLYVNLNGQDKQEYLIIDNFGSVVKRGVLENMSTEISVSELSAGLYYFKIAGTKPRKFSKIN
jgi:hypothetical protein